MQSNDTPMPSRVDVTCETCQQPFTAWRKDVRRGHARFCSRACWVTTGRTTVACGVCGSQFTRKASGRKRFCSKKCYGATRQTLRIPLPTPTVSEDGVTASLPLMGKGGIVRGYVLFDVADLDRVACYRWYMDASGYARRDEMTNGKRLHYLMHRDLMNLTAGDEREVDHINRSRTDNRRANLRIVDKSVQQQNLSKMRRGVSRYRGVSWSNTLNRWRVAITVGGKSTYIGVFRSEEEAGAAAREARLRLMPFAVD